MNTMQKRVDDKLRECLVETRRQDDMRLEEDMKLCEEHVFSEEFEANMQELFVVRSRKKNWKKIYRYAVSVAAVVLIVVGIASTSFTKTEASLPALDILEWLDNYFEFNKGNFSAEDGELIFEEVQIGYIPDGFSKMDEVKNHTYIRYSYSETSGRYFSVRVSKAATQSLQDNEDIGQSIFLNEDGYECAVIKQGDVISYIWEDYEGLYYYVSGNIGQDELEAVMNGILYEGEKQ